MWQRLREGRDVEHWKRIHARLNGDLPFVPPDSWLPLIRACDDYNPGCCAHPAAFCSRFARNTTREQCIECLTGQGITPPA